MIMSISTRRELRRVETKVQSMQIEIDAEKERTNDLQKQCEAADTREYIEQIARQKLGMAYKDEYVFVEK